MTVEVENDHYVAVESLEKTTIPYRDDSETEREARNECIKQEFELVDELERFRRLDPQRQEEEIRGHNNVYLRHEEEDLRDSMRRKSLGPADLRLTHWKRDQDLRVQMRPRLGSDPPDLRSLRNQRSEKSINERFSELVHGVEDRGKLIKRLQAGMSGQKTQSEEDHDNDVTADSYETMASDGEVAPSEDEITGVQYSESDKEPTQGPSRIPGEPITKAKKPISPIKYPEPTPKKKKEDLPLSKLETPRRQGVDARQDLRRKLEMVPVFSEPKLDSGNMRSRLGREPIGPWLPPAGPNRESPHSTRPFIARNVTRQDRGTGNSTEEEDDDVGTKGVDDPKNLRRK